MDTYDGEDGIFGEFIYGENGYQPLGYEGELWKYYWQNFDYAISTHGRVWSCKTNRFIKPVKSDVTGYLVVSMSYHGGCKNVFVHRLVAEMFIPNPYDLPVVRHLDGDPTNNVVWNLAWGTAKDNYEDSVRHGTARLFSDEDSEKGCAVTRRPVIAISESNGSQIWFPSQHDAARELNLIQAHISECVKGHRKHTGGYSFVRAEGGDANADCPEQLY